ncbi:MAG TPA: hypothetical protein VK731_03875, partial [Candidatus Cybelea sp.]|nr:hypothetical protein [Candidatus Cybelea sp.]
PSWPINSRFADASSRMKSNPPVVPGSRMGSPGVSGAADARQTKASEQQAALIPLWILQKRGIFDFDMMVPFLVAR